MASVGSSYGAVQHDCVSGCGCGAGPGRFRVGSFSCSLVALVAYSVDSIDARVALHLMHLLVTGFLPAQAK